MAKLNKYTFFIRWFLQREGHVTPKQGQVLAIVVMAVGLFINNRILSSLGAGFFLFNYIAASWMEYRSRKSYEGYLRDQNKKES